MVTCLREMACKLQSDQSNDLLYVTKGDVYCGYRKEYLAQNLSKMEEGLVACKRCSGIMREASLSEGETTCLVCSDTPKQLNPVKAVQDSIRMLGIKCPLLKDCDWKGELSEAETHLKDCLFFLIQCQKCEQIFPRGGEEEHGRNYCPKRIIKCECCSKGGKAEDKEEHLQYCEGYLVSCPNECGAKLPRRVLTLHRSVCELEVIACPYKEYGCRAESMLRRDLLAHKNENIVAHTDFSLVQISQSQSEIKQLKDENVRLKKEQNEMKWKIKTLKGLDGVEWKIMNIDKCKYVEKIQGPTFYVNNYRLKLYRVYYKYSSNKSRFYVKRIEGELDGNLGLACITRYRIITVNTRDYSKSEYEEGRMNYQLKIGTESEMIELQRHFYEHILLRFYFDVNSNPLKSLDVDYSNTTPTPPSTPESFMEYDPWGNFSDSD